VLRITGLPLPFIGLFGSRLYMKSGVLAPCPVCILYACSNQPCLSMTVQNARTKPSVAGHTSVQVYVTASSCHLFVNLILVPVPPFFPTHLFLHPSLLSFFIHHFLIHNFLSRPITPGLKRTCFTNPTPVVSLLPLHGLLPGPFILNLSYSFF